MSLLGVAARRPALQVAYYMPRDLYDPTDTKDHPVLVVAIDELRHEALVVTRTTNPVAKGPLGVPHRAAPELHLEFPGWWRLHRRHRVAWTAFNDPDVWIRGSLDDDTWERVTDTLFGTVGDA